VQLADAIGLDPLMVAQAKGAAHLQPPERGGRDITHADAIAEVVLDFAARLRSAIERRQSPG
jgi:hypothetical protein